MTNEHHTTTDAVVLKVLLEIKEDVGSVRSKLEAQSEDAKSLRDDVKAQDERITKLERWKARANGAFAVLAALGSALLAAVLGPLLARFGL